MVTDHEHYCVNSASFPPQKFLQIGIGVGKKILILGEAPAPNGWRKSGKAFYSPQGKLLPTGKNLNILLEPYSLNVENCSFTELIKCFVGQDRQLLHECGRKCWPIFVSQLELLECKSILILGVQTLKTFNSQLGSDLNIGQFSSASIANKTYKVLPIYHPSPIGPFNHRKNLEIFDKQIIKDIFNQITNS